MRRKKAISAFRDKSVKIERLDEEFEAVSDQKEDIKRREEKQKKPK